MNITLILKLEHHAFTFDKRGKWSVCFVFMSSVSFCFLIDVSKCASCIAKTSRVDVRLTSNHLSNAFLKVLGLTLGARCNKWQWCVKWDAFEVWQYADAAMKCNLVKNSTPTQWWKPLYSFSFMLNSIGSFIPPNTVCLNLVLKSVLTGNVCGFFDNSLLRDFIVHAYHICISHFIHNLGLKKCSGFKQLRYTDRFFDY